MKLGDTLNCKQVITRRANNQKRRWNPTVTKRKDTIMKTRKRRSLVSAILAALSVTFFSGCSGIGFLVGSGIDGGKPERDTVAISQLESLQQSDKIEIIYKNGAELTGKFAKLELLPERELADAYEQFRFKHLAYKFPRLGDTLIVQRRFSNSSFRYTFEGFVPGRLVTRQISDGEKVMLQIARLETIENSDGSSVDLATWTQLLNTNNVPFASSLVVKTDSADVNVNINLIQRIERTNSRNAKWVGLALGLAADVAVLFYAASNMSFGIRAF